MTAVTRSALYHLKNNQQSQRGLFPIKTEKTIHAPNSSRVDYYNALLSGLPKKTIRELKLIENAAVCLLTKTHHPVTWGFTPASVSYKKILNTLICHLMVQV